MSRTNIEWTERTWNPITGCSKISEGCQNCYAAVMTERLKSMGQPKYEKGFNTVVCHEETLNDPYKWRKPRMVFVNSMSDLFHDNVPDLFIRRVFGVMNDKRNQNHIFQILTKRPDRLADLALTLNWTPNIWVGVTVESDRHYDRINKLCSVPAKIRFLSLEPLLTPLPDLNLKGIDWVITGGESGSQARPMNAEWVRDIRDLCYKQKVAFLFKQWSGFHPKKLGCWLDGKQHKEFPKTIVIDQSSSFTN